MYFSDTIPVFGGIIPHNDNMKYVVVFDTVKLALSPVSLELLPMLKTVAPWQYNNSYIDLLLSIIGQNIL